MGYTNETAILKLPQFIGSDKPSWLSDINGAMLKIDRAVGDNIGGIAEAKAQAAAAQSKADSADAAVTAMGSEVSRIATEVDSLDSMVDTLQADVENINTQLSSFITSKLSTIKSYFARTPNNSFTSEFWEFKFNNLPVFLYGPASSSTQSSLPTTTIGNLLYQVGGIKGNPFSLAGQSFVVGNTISWVNAGQIWDSGNSGYHDMWVAYNSASNVTYFCVLLGGTASSARFDNAWLLWLRRSGSTNQIALTNLPVNPNF